MPEGSVEEKYAVLFHTEIDRLIKLGFSDLEEFKIPAEEITRRVAGFNYGSNSGQTYFNEKYIDREFFLIKLDEILLYFEVSSPKTEIGFKPE